MNKESLLQSMSSNPKREAAIKILASTGIWRSSYAPPLLRLLWRLGFDAPPPHFVSFSAIALFSGSYFAITLGCLCGSLIACPAGPRPPRQ
jgi:hypothetical protein